MPLQTLLDLLRQADHNDLSIAGSYGCISARPDGGRHLQTLEPTYQVDAEYQAGKDQARVKVKQSGFRFSTVCCMCATVCLGEDNVNLQVIANINQLFA